MWVDNSTLRPGALPMSSCLASLAVNSVRGINHQTQNVLNISERSDLWTSHKFLLASDDRRPQHQDAIQTCSSRYLARSAIRICNQGWTNSQPGHFGEHDDIGTQIVSATPVRTHPLYCGASVSRALEYLPDLSSTSASPQGNQQISFDKRPRRRTPRCLYL